MTVGGEYHRITKDNVSGVAVVQRAPPAPKATTRHRAGISALRDDCPEEKLEYEGTESLRTQAAEPQPQSGDPRGKLIPSAIQSHRRPS